MRNVRQSGYPSRLQEIILSHIKRFVGEKCHLAIPIPEDGEKWRVWDNNLELVLPASGSGYRTPATALYTEKSIPKDVPLHFFSIVDLETDQAIGWCKLDRVHPINRRGDISIVIGEPGYRGRGYGQDAIRLLLDVAFNVVNLESVELSVFEYNKHAIECYKRVGFKEAGRLRHARIVGGKAHDVIVMDILSSEFEHANSNVRAAISKEGRPG
jgi:RimJ/RimL family protein N-acetyltransferase